MYYFCLFVIICEKLLAISEGKLFHKQIVFSAGKSNK